MIAQETIRDMYLTEIGDIREQMGKMSQQIVRTQRSVKLDEHDFQLANMQYQRDSTRQLMSLTASVEALLNERYTDPAYQLQLQSEDLHARKSIERQREIDKSLRQIRFLSKLRQEKTLVCPCGEHKGITFFDAQNNPVNGKLCPKVWWIKLSRLALEEGRLNSFLTSTPLDKYMSAFSK